MAKKSDSEKLDDSSLERVIKLLEPKNGEKPITKKDACSILNITYNTTRLSSIIEKYKEKKERDKVKRAEKRGKPASESEVSYTIQSYLEGNTVDSIAKTLYRSPTFVGTILEKYSVPKRVVGHSYFKPGLIPEEACRESFKLGEKVWSARYDCMAEIMSEFKPGQYRIYLMSDSHPQFAYQPAEELASLEHLRKVGVNV